MRKTLLIIALLTAGISNAQEIATMTLEQAKLYALENNYTVQNSLQDVEIARQQIVETRGMGLPQVNMNGTFNHFVNRPVTVLDAKFLNPAAPDGETVSFQAGTEYTANGTFEVSQLLFNGSYIIGLKAARFFAEFQKTVSTQTQEQIVFNTIQTYQIATVAKRNKQFMDSLVISSERMLEQQQHYFDLGLMLQEDLDQLHYSLLSAKSAQLAANLQYENTMNMLKLSIGYPVGNTLEISNTPEELIIMPSISNADIHNNLSFQILEQQVRLSQFNLQNNQFANLPSLNAFFQQQYNAYRNEFDFFADKKWYPQTLWGIRLDIPIFSGLSRYSRTSQAKIKLLKDQNSLAQMEQNLQFQELQIRNQLRTAENNLELKKKNVELAEGIFNNAIVKEKIGKGNSIIVTQKHSQLMMAQSEYIGAMIDLFQAKLELDKLYNNILPNK